MGLPGRTGCTLGGTGLSLGGTALYFNSVGILGPFYRSCTFHTQYFANFENHIVNMGMPLSLYRECTLIEGKNVTTHTLVDTNCIL